MATKPTLKEEERFGQASFVFENDTVEVSVTEVGGMTAPVVFTLPDGRGVSPYYVNPWHGEARELDEPVLVPLRGDFFCLPFGASNDMEGESYGVHGESAGKRWTPGALGESGGVTSFAMTMDYAATKGTVTKELTLRAGEQALYIEHSLAGFSGAYPLGHHATLAGSVHTGELAISVKPFDLGLTSPVFPWFQADGEYYSLQPDQGFTALESVPTVWKDEPTTDCSVFPNRKGFVDIMATYRKSAADAAPEDRLAWTCAVNRNQGWIWFSLKDASVLPATVFWMENHGRHQPPWDGRNCCIGLEEVCGFFANGRVDSVGKNRVSEAGIPTAVNLSADRMTRVRAIHGMAPAPKGFEKVTDLVPKKGAIELRDGSGKSVEVSVGWEFLFDGADALL